MARDAVFSFSLPETVSMKCFLFFAGYALVGLGTGVYVET